jgi:hypothetical protein
MKKPHRKNTHQHKTSGLMSPEPTAKKPRQSSISPAPTGFMPKPPLGEKSSQWFVMKFPCHCSPDFDRLKPYIRLTIPELKRALRHYTASKKR